MKTVCFDFEDLIEKSGIISVEKAGVIGGGGRSKTV